MREFSVLHQFPAMRDMRASSMKLFYSLVVVVSVFPDAARGAVVFQDTGGNVQRPTSVTGLSVSGTSYDVTITYGIPISSGMSQLIGALPNGDANSAAIALQTAVNAAAVANGIDSQETVVFLLSNMQPAQPGPANSLGSIDDMDPGNGDFGRTLQDTSELVAPGRVSRGAAVFSLAGQIAAVSGTSQRQSQMQVTTNPEPSTFAIWVSVAVTAALRQRRRRRTVETSGAASPRPTHLASPDSDD